jgi:hypothetical protein
LRVTVGGEIGKRARERKWRKNITIPETVMRLYIGFYMGERVKESKMIMYAAETIEPNDLVFREHTYSAYPPTSCVSSPGVLIVILLVLLSVPFPISLEVSSHLHHSESPSKSSAKPS